MDQSSLQRDWLCPTITYAETQSGGVNLPGRSAHRQELKPLPSDNHPIRAGALQANGLMTQRQLDISGFTHDEFRRIQLLEGEAICELNHRFAVVVKRQRHSLQIFLKSGNRRLKLPFDIFESICRSQISVTFLKHYLEEWKTSDC